MIKHHRNYLKHFGIVCPDFTFQFMNIVSTYQIAKEADLTRLKCHAQSNVHCDFILHYIHVM